MNEPRVRFRRRLRAAASHLSWAATLTVVACAPGRPAVVGSLPDASPVADAARASTRLTEPTWIEFSWELNEEGARARGDGVARIEPPYRARLDLFHESGETVAAVAVVDDELRIPPGAVEDILPPIDLMWGTLGVFRPLEDARMLGGDRLDGGGRRLRYAHDVDHELHFELIDESLSAVELLEGGTLVQWVRVDRDEEGGFPLVATYRNLIDFRELKIERTSTRVAEPFDPSIFDPR